MTYKDRRRHLKFRQLHQWLFGDRTSAFAQQQISLLVTAFAFLIMAAAFNLWMGVSHPALAWIYFALAPAVAWLWWWARWRSASAPASLILLLALVLIVLPATWFLNGGSQGPTLIFFLVVLSFTVGIIRSHIPGWRTAMAFLLFSPVVLLVLEWYWPEWVYPYIREADRLTDLIISYVSCALLISIVIIGHVRRFNQEIEKAQTLTHQLRELAQRDSLTGLLNHASIHKEAMNLLHHEQPFCLMMLDIDEFKRVNDTHGHLYGDDVLRQLSLAMQTVATEHHAHPGRFGGEEFMIIVPGVLSNAQQLDDALRAQVAALDLPKGPITYSAGIAQWQAGEHLNSLIQRADQALYNAKDLGRQRTSISP
ncbi:GGDEF domain-containing protein [Salinispirillum marinum]|uniref:diguanylate cyclase n=2 Tax=Saccharospirillaceae TaxID=255527 RepID=A0ABV8BCQ2_9GAMM